MADYVPQLLTALVVGILIIVSVSVFHSAQDNSLSTYEVAVAAEATSESTGTTRHTVSDCKLDSITWIGNDTHPCNSTGEFISCSVQYLPGEPAVITTNASSGVLNVNYTSYTGDGYTTFEKARTGTYGGFSLATVLPIVIFSILVITILVKAFAGF